MNTHTARGVENGETGVILVGGLMGKTIGIDTGPAFFRGIPLSPADRRHLARLLIESAANEEAERRVAEMPAVVSPAGAA